MLVLPAPVGAQIRRFSLLWYATGYTTVWIRFNVLQLRKASCPICMGRDMFMYTASTKTHLVSEQYKLQQILVKTFIQSQHIKQFSHIILTTLIYNNNNSHVVGQLPFQQKCSSTNQETKFQFINLSNNNPLSSIHSYFLFYPLREPPHKWCNIKSLLCKTPWYTSQHISLQHTEMIV